MSTVLAFSLFYSRSQSTSIPAAAAVVVKEDDFISALATMIEAKVIITPTIAAVEAQAYDRARTNIQVLILLIDFLVYILIYYTAVPIAVDASMSV